MIELAQHVAPKDADEPAASQPHHHSAGHSLCRSAGQPIKRSGGPLARQEGHLDEQVR